MSHTYLAVTRYMISEDNYESYTFGSSGGSRLEVHNRSSNVCANR